MVLNTPHFSEEGPWALVIMFSCFCLKAIIYGVTLNFGLYTVEFLKYFDSSAAAVSLIGGINHGVIRVAGPVVSVLTRVFSYRAIIITGGIISSIGVLLMVFANDVATLCVVYGIIAGTGFCLCFIPTFVLTGLFFKKYMPIAVTFTEVGVSFGTALMPLLIDMLIRKYSWRGSLYILSGICLQSVVAGALCRPPKRSLHKREESCHVDKEATNNEVASSITDEVEHKIETTSMVKEQTEDQFIAQQHTAELTALEIPPFERQTCSKTTETRRLLSDGNISPSQCSGKNTDQSTSRKCQKIKLFLKDYMKLLKNTGFTMYLLSIFFVAFNLAMYYTLAPAFFSTTGLEETDVARLLTLLFMIEIPFDILAGVLANTSFINVPVLYAVTVLIAGITFPFYLFVQTHATLAVLVAILGSCTGVFVSLRVVLIIHFVGVEHLADATGLTALSTGIAFFCGPPIAGFLLDVTGNYDSMFYCAFVVQCLAVLIMAIPPLKKRLSRKKETAGSNDRTTNPDFCESIRLGD